VIGIYNLWPTIPYDPLKNDYDNQICLDFPSVTVEVMKSHHTNEGVERIVCDVRDMPIILTQSVDVALDKEMLQAMIRRSTWSPPEEVMKNTRRYIDKILASC
jgi:hypothetical protein